MKHEFKSFWFGKALSPYEILCMKSFIENGHAFCLYTYDEKLVVPDGVELRDASLILPRDEIFFYTSGPGAGSVAAFANRFRYALLYRTGGWWVDTDMICLPRELPDSEYFFAFQDKNTINNGMLRFPAEDPVMLACYERATAAGKDLAWGTTGPKLLTSVLSDLNMTKLAKPVSSCYPLEWSEYHHFFDPRMREEVELRTKSSIAVHLWNEMIRRVFDKRKAPPRLSYLGNLFEQHDVHFTHGQMRAYEIHLLQQKIRVRGGLTRRLRGEQKWFQFGPESLVSIPTGQAVMLSPLGTSG